MRVLPKTPENTLARTTIYNLLSEKKQTEALLHGIVAVKVPGSTIDRYVYNEDSIKQTSAALAKQSGSIISEAIDEQVEKRIAAVQNLTTKALSDSVAALTQEREELKADIELAKSLTEYDKKLVAGFHKVLEATPEANKEEMLQACFANGITDEVMASVYEPNGATAIGRKWAAINYLLGGYGETK
jgi:hypothetical protein